MADVNDIQAGEYELVADHWDEITSKPTEPFDYVRHYKGETVTLDKPTARRLVTAGAVRKPGEAELAAALALQAQYAALIAQMPDALRAQLVGETTVEELAEETPDEIPADQRTVGDPGAELANEGERPRVASASSGEGDGEIQEPGSTEPAPAPAAAAKRSGRS